MIEFSLSLERTFFPSCHCCFPILTSPMMGSPLWGYIGITVYTDYIRLSLGSLFLHLGKLHIRPMAEAAAAGVLNSPFVHPVLRAPLTQWMPPHSLFH